MSRLVTAETDSRWIDRDEHDLAEYLEGRGWQVERVWAKDLERGRVALDRSTLVVGSIQSVRAALRILGTDLPLPDDYPDVLQPYLHRRIWSSTVGSLRGQLADGDGLPVFAKSKDLKRFTGRVFESTDDLRFLAGISKHAEIWCSEVVVWRSEWRVLVVNDLPIGKRLYSGEPWTQPDDEVIAECVARLVTAEASPAGYAIDFGVLADGTTALIERNDGFAFGSYGLDVGLYAQVLIARWTELLARIPG